MTNHSEGEGQEALHGGGWEWSNSKQSFLWDEKIYCRKNRSTMLSVRLIVCHCSGGARDQLQRTINKHNMVPF